MPYLVRRINRSKWESYDFKSSDNPPADAITNCLRTYNNDLSTWKIETLDDLENAILCLITGSKQENLNTIHIIFFDIDLIQKYKLNISQTAGDTVISEWEDSHIDITQLNYESLGAVKDLIIDCLRADNVKTITRGDLKKMLKKASEKDILDTRRLNQRYQEDII